MAAHIVKADEANWDSEVVASETPVLVEFSGPRCGLCKILLPTLESVATEYAGRLKIVEVDCEDNKALADRFGVRGLPTLQLMRLGSVVTVVHGRTLTRIAEELDRHLG